MNSLSRRMVSLPLTYSQKQPVCTSTLALTCQALRYPPLFRQNHFPNGKSDVAILLKIPSRNP